MTSLADFMLHLAGGDVHGQLQAQEEEAEVEFEDEDVAVATAMSTSAQHARMIQPEADTSPKHAFFRIVANYPAR